MFEGKKIKKKKSSLYVKNYSNLSVVVVIVCKNLFQIVSAHECKGHVTRFFSTIGETFHRWSKQISSHLYMYFLCNH